MRARLCLPLLCISILVAACSTGAEGGSSVFIVPAGDDTPDDMIPEEEEEEEPAVPPNPFFEWVDALGTPVGALEPLYLDANGRAWWVDPFTASTPANPAMPGIAARAATPIFASTDCTGTAYILPTGEFEDEWENLVPPLPLGFPFRVVGQAALYLLPEAPETEFVEGGSILTATGCMTGIYWRNVIELADALPGVVITAPNFSAPLRPVAVESWTTLPPVWVDAEGTAIGSLLSMSTEPFDGEALLLAYGATAIAFDTAGYGWPVDTVLGTVEPRTVSRVYEAADCTGTAYLLFGPNNIPSLLPRLQGYVPGMVFYVDGVAGPRTLPDATPTVAERTFASIYEEDSCDSISHTDTSIAYTDTLAAAGALRPEDFVQPLHLEPAAAHDVPVPGWMDANDVLVTAGSGRAIDDEGLLHFLIQDLEGVGIVFEYPVPPVYASGDCTGDPYIPVESSPITGDRLPIAPNTPFVFVPDAGEFEDIDLYYVPHTVTPVPLVLGSINLGICLAATGTINAISISNAVLYEPGPAFLDGLDLPLSLVPLTIE